MRSVRTPATVGTILVVVLLAPVTAAPRPPEAPASLASLRSVFVPAPPPVGAHVVMSRLTRTPAGARPGHAYVLRGNVVNEGSAAARRSVVVHLLRPGTVPVAIGRASLHLPAHELVPYRVHVRLPRILANGSYSVVACARQSCVTAARHLQIGEPLPVRLPAAAAAGTKCASGAHSLSPLGAHVYPETGNGGYTSVHSDVFLNYDTESNLFLPGTHVVHTDRAAQCLTDFSLDFERSSANTTDGPSLAVSAVFVNGKPATFAFVQPTYPGD